MESVTLDQNIPTRLWGAHVVATNVVDGESADLRITRPGEMVSVHPVRVGDLVDVGDVTATVAGIAGGGHEGPPGRSTGRVVLIPTDGDEG